MFSMATPLACTVTPFGSSLSNWPSRITLLRSVPRQHDVLVTGQHLHALVVDARADEHQRARRGGVDGRLDRGELLGHAQRAMPRRRAPGRDLTGVEIDRADRDEPHHPARGRAVEAAVVAVHTGLVETKLVVGAG